MRARVLEALIAAWHASTAQPDTQALAAWWRQIDGWRAKDSLKFTQDMTPGAIIKPQYAIQRLYELTRAVTKEIFITTEVGQHQMWAAQHFRIRGAQPLDDLGRARHHGLRPAGGDGRAGGASRGAGDRHRRRGQRC